MYTLPTFNLTFNVWHNPNLPPAAPDLTPIGQLYVNPRPQGQDSPLPMVYLRVPMGTDIRVDDTVEAAAGDNKWYSVVAVERMHRGFTNEYLVGLAFEIGDPTPPGGSAILMEDGFYILMEDGASKILLE